MSWIEDLLARLETVDTVVDAIKLITDALPDAGALTTIQADLDNPNQYKADLSTLETRLSVARAALLDEITAARLQELDGANIPADIDTLLTRITEAVATAGALATVDTEVGNIETKLDTPANFMADLSTLETRLSAIRAGYLDELNFDLQGLLNNIAGYIDAEITTIITSQGRQRDRIVKWSEGKVQVVIDAAGATTLLSTITIDTLPTGATIASAYLMVKFRMIENKYAGVNKLNGGTVALTSQVFQIQDDGGGAWTDGINLPDDYFTLADGAREGGDVLVGTLNVGVSNVVDGNDTYNIRLLLGKADQDFINFDECQAGLDILYSV